MHFQSPHRSPIHGATSLSEPVRAESRPGDVCGHRGTALASREPGSRPVTCSPSRGCSVESPVRDTSPGNPIWSALAVCRFYRKTHSQIPKIETWWLMDRVRRHESGRLKTATGGGSGPNQLRGAVKGRVTHERLPRLGRAMQAIKGGCKRFAQLIYRYFHRVFGEILQMPLATSLVDPLGLVSPGATRTRPSAIEASVAMRSRDSEYVHTAAQTLPPSISRTFHPTQTLGTSDTPSCRGHLLPPSPECSVADVTPQRPAGRGPGRSASTRLVKGPDLPGWGTAALGTRLSRRWQKDPARPSARPSPASEKQKPWG